MVYQLSYYEGKLAEVIRPYYKLKNVIRDLRHGLPKATEPAAKALEVLEEIMEE